MSGYPHGLSAPTEIKPVTHTVEWREDGVATVRWCGVKYLFNAGLVLNPGETKPCPVCGIELHHDEKKKEVVEFPKLSPTEPGGQMNVRNALETIRGTRYCDHEGFDDRCHNCTAWLVKGEVYADLAPVIEKALRVTAQKMAELLAHELQTGTRGDPKELLAKCVTAGVAAMVEGP